MKILKSVKSVKFRFILFFCIMLFQIILGMGFYIYVRSDFLFQSFGTSAVRNVPEISFAVMAIVEILMSIQLVMARRV